ncbi:MAG: MarR family winged helix-turn-helix transcriptional regulator [Faecousia sp.]
MDYAALANELLSVRANLLQVPASQQLSQMVRGEMFVLNYLVTHENTIHPKELSEKMAVTTARIASLLNHMEEKKLIRRSTDPNDSRQVDVVLTEEGKKAIQEMRAQVISYVSAMLQELGPEDAEAYIRIQKKIWNNFRQNP